MNYSHGHKGRNYRSPTYNTWTGVKSRCTNLKSEAWAAYGGRGIRLCARWLVFENFLADMGDRPEGTSLDRIDVDGNYEPNNCRWATPTEQANNKRAHKAMRTLEHLMLLLTLVPLQVSVGHGADYYEAK